MEFRQTQLSQAVAAAKQYFVTFASVLPRTIASGALQMLDELVDGFRVQAGQQDTKTSDLRGEVAQKAALQTALLRDHLAPIVAAAQLKLRGTPNFDGIAMPNPAWGISRIVARARGIAGSVAPYADQLIAVGLPSDFLAQLDTAVTALETAATTARTHRAARVSATESLKQHEVNAAGVLKVLDRMVKSELGDNPPALAGWLSVKKILTSKTVTTTPASTTAASTPSTPASSTTTATAPAGNKPVASEPSATAPVTATPATTVAPAKEVTPAA